MNNYIVFINFTNRKEEGCLTFKTKAYTWEQAKEKAEKYVDVLNEDSEDVYFLGNILDFDMIMDII